MIVFMLAGGGKNQFELVSTAFEDGKVMPSKYARAGVTGGQNISVPLEWNNAPEGTKSFALACVDRHPIANNWVHWLVINIPKDTHRIPEAASGTSKMPAGSKELNNTFGDRGYGGPQPPKGSGPHKYEFTLYALSVDGFNLELQTSLSRFLKAIEGKVLGEAKTIGIFER